MRIEVGAHDDACGGNAIAIMLHVVCDCAVTQCSCRSTLKAARGRQRPPASESIDAILGAFVGWEGKGKGFGVLLKGRSTLASASSFLHESLLIPCASNAQHDRHVRAAQGANLCAMHQLMKSTFALLPSHPEHAKRHVLREHKTLAAKGVVT